MNPVVKSRLLNQLSTAADVTALVSRAELQLDFAEALVGALKGKPELPKGAVEAVGKAKALLEGFDPAKGLGEAAALVAQIEQVLAEVGRVAKTYTIHCVGHGHIDMNWMWSWPETVSSTHDTFASVLNLMDQYPEFTYSQSQTSVYAAIQKYHPAMFEEIRERVKEGRWEVSASHWVEGDKNLASGEALARHLLFTRDYFAEHFGLSPEDVPIDWEPDTFGHANTLPMVDSAGAVKFYYSCRPGGGNAHARVGDERPPLFYWQAPNGNRILVNKETTWYNSYINIGENVALALAEFIKTTGIHHWLNVYGVGNHGGGPTRDEIEHLIRLDGLPIYPNVKFSTAKRYYEAAEEEIQGSKIEIPVLDHELNFEFTGCYTSQSLIKQANRLGENYCCEAETLALLSGLQAESLLREAWIHVLFNQFHDILPGSCIRDSREHARGLFQEVGAITGAIKRDALKALASKIDTVSLLPKNPEGAREKALGDAANTEFVAGAGIEAGDTGFSIARGGGSAFRPFVVYNPCPWTRSEPVKVSLYDTDFEPRNIVAMDEKGNSHATVFLGKGHDWAHDRLDLMFLATDVPGCGYRTYLLCEGVPDVKAAGVKAHDYDTFRAHDLTHKMSTVHGCLEGLPAEFHGETGQLFGNWLLETEIGPRKNAWVLGESDGGENLYAKSFRTVGFKENAGTGLLTEGEPVVAGANWSLRVPGRESSKVDLFALFHPLAPRVDFDASIDWREFGTPDGFPGLKVEFETLGPTFREWRFETPFGSVLRPSDVGSEVPSLRYVHGFAEEGFGFTLLQDSKYGFEVWETGVQMRVLRSSMNPDDAPEVAKSRLRYSVVFHASRPTTAELTRLGAAWNHPFIVAPANLQSGPAPAVQGFAEVKTEGVVMSCLKQSLHGGGIVLRLTDYTGKDAQAEVVLNPALVEGAKRAFCVDLMERETEGTAVIGGSTLKVRVPAHSFVTVKVM